MGAKSISVLLVDDHPMAIAGVRQMIETDADIQVVGEAMCAAEAMTQLAIRHVDVALVDIDLPDENGLALLQHIKRMAPHTAVVILSTYGEEMYALRALKAGADGYLTKSVSLSGLIHAVRKVAGGGKQFSNFLNDLLVRQVQRGEIAGKNALTPREFDIMMQIVAGESIGAIAARLDRSPKTVSTHRARLLEKLHLHSNAQLARYAIEQGLVGPAPRK
ncbi:response regulator [Massilia sp. DWR3-1-1]|uniref:response regulator n=1 Tax=Massilia sp. DWR3-1-1 TaxID=2804559 RepID=UPI003CE8D674